MMAANYRHIGGGVNRLGRHYSRFSGFWPMAPVVDQSLALRKSQNRESNRRRRVKELQAELGLERLDLMAHLALSDAKFLGSARDASVPRRGIERPQRVELWQGAAHSAPLYMNRIGSGPRNDALPAAGRCSHLRLRSP